MEGVKYFIEDLRYYIQEHKWVKVVGLTIIGVIILFSGLFMVGRSVKNDDVENGQDVVIEGVSEETLHILTNPEDYDPERVDKAYHDSLTTFDNQFVEDNVVKGKDLEDGVYLYHEKNDDEFREVASLAKQVGDLGVPIHFYTPQYDQSIARLANDFPVIEKGEVVIYGIIIREGNLEEAEYKTTKEGVIKYLGGILNENK